MKRVMVLILSALFFVNLAIVPEARTINADDEVISFSGGMSKDDPILLSVGVHYTIEIDEQFEVDHVAGVYQVDDLNNDLNDDIFASSKVNGLLTLYIGSSADSSVYVLVVDDLDGNPHSFYFEVQNENGSGTDPSGPDDPGTNLPTKETTVSFLDGKDDEDLLKIYADSVYLIEIDDLFVADSIVGVYMTFDINDREDNVADPDNNPIVSATIVEENIISLTILDEYCSQFVLIVNDNDGKEHFFYFEIKKHYTFMYEGTKYQVGASTVEDSEQPLVISDKVVFKSSGSDQFDYFFVAVAELDDDYNIIGPASERIVSLVRENLEISVLNGEGLWVNDDNEYNQNIYEAYGIGFNGYCIKIESSVQSLDAQIEMYFSIDSDNDEEYESYSEYYNVVVRSVDNHSFSVDDLSEDGPAADIAALNSILSSKENLELFTDCSLDEFSLVTFVFSQDVTYPGVIEVNSLVPVAFESYVSDDDYSYYYSPSKYNSLIDIYGEDLPRATIQGGIISTGGLQKVDNICFEASDEFKVKYNGNTVTAGIMIENSSAGLQDPNWIYGCSFEGYDYGILSYQHGLASGILHCMFIDNRTAIKYDTGSYTNWNPSEYDTFIDNTVAIDYYLYPSVDSPYYGFENSYFLGEGTDYKVAGNGSYYCDYSYYGKQYIRGEYWPYEDVCVEDSYVVSFSNENTRYSMIEYAEGSEARVITGPSIRFPEDNDPYGFELDEIDHEKTNLLECSHTSWFNSTQFKEGSNIDIVLADYKNHADLGDLAVLHFGGKTYAEDAFDVSIPFYTSVNIEENAGYFAISFNDHNEQNNNTTVFDNFLSATAPMVDVYTTFSNAVVLKKSIDGKMSQIPINEVSIHNGAVSFPVDEACDYLVVGYSHENGCYKFLCTDFLCEIIENMTIHLPTEIHYENSLAVYINERYKSGENYKEKMRELLYGSSDEDGYYEFDPATGVVSICLSNEKWDRNFASAEICIYNSSNPVILRYNSLTENGQIGVNFKMFFPDLYYSSEDIRKGTSIKVSRKKNGQDIVIEKTIEELGPDSINSENLMVFSLPLPVKELGDDISLEIFSHYSFDPATGDPVYHEDPIKVDMKSYSGRDLNPEDEIFVYNTLDMYIEQEIGNTVYDELTREVFRSLNDYVNAAQLYFKYNYADSKVDQAALDKVRADDVLFDYAAVINEPMPDSFGMIHTTASLILNDQTTLRHYFVLDEGEDIDNYDFSVSLYHINYHTDTIDANESDDDDIEIIEENKNGQKRYILEIRNIPAPELRFMETIEVRKKGDVSEDYYSIDYCPLSYAYSVLKMYDDDKDNKDLTNFVKALYLYSDATYQYFYKEAE